MNPKTKDKNMIFETSQIVATGVLASLAGCVITLALVMYYGMKAEEARIKDEVLKADKRLKDQIAARNSVG